MSLRWAPSPGEIAEFDHAGWDGLTGRLMRRLDFPMVVRVWNAAVVLYGLAAVALLFVWLAERDHIGHLEARALLAAVVLAAGSTVALAVLLTFLTPPAIKRLWGSASVFVFVAAAVLITVALAAKGTHSNVPAILYCSGPVFAVYILKRWVAVLVVVLEPVMYGALLIWQRPTLSSFASWLTVTSTIVGVALLMGGITRRIEELRASERRAHNELSALNASLEARVQHMVVELERMGRLRRFLPPRVAEVVASDASEELLAPHRRRIATFFCDLRGFTAFTNRTEPEAVLTVVTDYFNTVGEVLRRYDATIAQYTGDGIMAFFGDPVETENPSQDAVEMAVELRVAMVPLLERWHLQGHDLGHAVGLAYGHATLGVVGTEGRYDYTPLGPVVNLAARLCANAQPGQILIDHATFEATSGMTPSSYIGDLELKGFGPATPAYALN